MNLVSWNCLRKKDSFGRPTERSEGASKLSLVERARCYSLVFCFWGFGGGESRWLDHRVERTAASRFGFEASGFMHIIRHTLSGLSAAVAHSCRWYIDKRSRSHDSY